MKERGGVVREKREENKHLGTELLRVGVNISSTQSWTTML